jgi:hypothetical protein
MEEPFMKHGISLSLSFLVLLALLLQGAPAGNTVAQLRQPGEIIMSPEIWPQGEMEKYWQLQKVYTRQQQAVEGGHGMVAVTSDAFAARVGLEALRRGGGAADAALGAALAQVALKGGRHDQLRRHTDDGLLRRGRQKGLLAKRRLQHGAGGEGPTDHSMDGEAERTLGARARIFRRRAGCA